MADSIIYLDHHATTPVDPRVLESMWPYFHQHFANAESQHQPGRLARTAVEQAREQLATCLHASPHEFIFTSCATEANNLAIKGIMQAHPEGHLIVNAAEHSSVLDVALRLRRQGRDVTVVPVNSTGCVEPESIRAALTDRTILISTMLANNEVGTINDLAAIAEICHHEGVLLHTDAVAAFGRMPVNLAELPVDLASFSAHKIHGPKGVGALFLRKSERRIRMEPLFHGGGQEHRLRSGTLAVPLIVGFGTACQLISEKLPSHTTLLQELTQQFRDELAPKVRGLRWNGPVSNRLPGNLNFSVDGVDGPALLVALEHELAVSSGAACSSLDPEPSHVLQAMGLPEGLCRASVRIGLGRTTTAEEVSQAVDCIASAVERLQSAET